MDQFAQIAANGIGGNAALLEPVTPIPHETVINNIPNHNRGLIFSLNIISAIIAVATISKLLSSDALAAVVAFNPNIKQIGAAMSKSIIATVYGNSDFVSFNSFVSVFPK